MIVTMITYSVTQQIKSKPRPPGTDVNTIVMHSTAGASLDGDLNTLEERGVGYHYLIDRDGKVYKLVPLKRQTGHAGSSYGPQEAAAGLDRSQYPFTKENRDTGRVHHFVAGCSVNRYTVGISFCNKNDGKEAITLAQFASALDLVAAVRRQFPRMKWITCHYEVSPKRKSDPRLFDLEAFAQKVGLKPWRFSDSA